MKTARLAAIALIALPTLAACSSSGDSDPANKDALTFAAVPAESSQSLQSDYGNLVKLLEKETGMKVEFQNASDYAAVIEGQRAGKIDIASYGPFSYVIAHDSGAPIDAVASPTHDESEPPAYTALAYVKKDSPISSLKDIKGKKVCFVDPSSTSGYLLPMKGILDAGLDFEADIEPIIAGGHDSSLITLNEGGCDVAFGHDTILKTLDATGQVPENALKSIWESDPITEDPIALNTESLTPELREKIATAIQEKANKPALVAEGICASEQDCVLPEEIEWGYLKVDDSDFESIRETCKVTNAEACQAVS